MPNFLWQVKFRWQKNKWMRRKQIRSAVYKRNTRNYGQCRPINIEKAIKFGMRILNGAYRISFPLKVEKFEDFPHSWRLRNNNNFYLNVTEWLASPGGTKFSKPIEEMSKEELNVFLKRFCTSVRKKDGASSMQIHLRAAIDRFLRLLPLNKPFFVFLTRLLLRQIKYKSICKRLHKNGQHCRRTRAKKR